MFDKLARLFKRGAAEPKSEAFSPEEDIRLAEHWLGQGDLKHAAFHAGAALVKNANNPEWLSLLERIITCAPDPLELAPMGERNYAGTAAMHAYILAHIGRYSEALPLILQVAGRLPEAGYLEWPIRWLQNPAARNAVDLQPLIGFLGMFVNEDQRGPLSDTARKVTLERIPVLLETANDTQAVTSQQAFLFTVMLKRLDRLDIAEKIATRTFATHPDYHSANAMASIYRATGRQSEAVDMYRQAAAFDPSDAAVRLDAGDILEELERFAESAVEYEIVLKREPAHPWALPSYYAARYEETGDDSWAQKFAEYQQTNPSNQRARALQRIFRTYFGPVLPSPSEATINGVAQVLESGWKGQDKGEIEIGLSSLEAPSAMMACAMELTRKAGSPVRVNLQVELGKTPDPREPRVPVRYRLWRYNGAASFPAIDAPPADVVAAVGALAETSYSPQRWWADALTPARAIGPERVGEILAAMVNPAPVPEGMFTWDWMYRWQFAAAFLAARVDDGWDGSARKDALLSLANGATDWTVDTGVVLLALVAKDIPEAEPEITQLYIDLVSHAYTMPGYRCFLEPVLLSILELPNATPSLKEQAVDTLKKMHSAG